MRIANRNGRSVGNVTKAAAGAALIWAMSPMVVACDQPSLGVAMPDGRSASEQQMAEAQQAIQAFVAAGESYIQCLEGSGMAAAQQDRLRNQTIDEMESVAAQFNRQLRQFRRAQ